MDSLPFRRAFLEGYLLPHEYASCYGFASCIVLTIVMGVLLGREEPGWAGHLLWTGMLVVAFTVIPAVKWFGTYQVWIVRAPFVGGLGQKRQEGGIWRMDGAPG